MTDNDLLQEYLTLRNSVAAAQLATISPQSTPFASHAPIVWKDGSFYLFLSELSEHTQHLLQNPAIGLVLLQTEPAGNHFASQRITFQGRAEIVARDSERFATIIEAFHQKFGQVMLVIEPLTDFHLFQLNLDAGRYIRGFGQAYLIEGENFDQLTHINPAK
ncbi:MAG: pyridoxamine 5'-phosphate oxidase family protein [Pseudomonadota bacterium]